MSGGAYLPVGFTAEGKARPKLCWLFRLSLLLIGREASSKDKSRLSSVSQALKSAVSGPVSIRERNFPFKSHSEDHFQLCPLCLCCRAGPVSESLLSRGTLDPAQWQKGMDEGKI